MRSAHILVVRSGFPIPEDILDDAPNLVGVMRHGAGVDVIPMAAADRLLIPVANVPGGSAQSVAELGLIFMGMLSRHVRELDRTLRSQGWDQAQQLSAGGNNLAGKTVGIIGVGAIGGRLAKICGNGLDMVVLGHQRHMENLPDFVRPTDLDTLFSESDFVVLTCPLTDRTRHICSAYRFKMMKDSAVLINLGRGGLVHTRALVEALGENRIAGAGLDVFEEEPLPPYHPLVKNRRVILTPAHRRPDPAEFSLQCPYHRKTDPGTPAEQDAEVYREPPGMGTGGGAAGTYPRGPVRRLTANRPLR